MTIGIATIMPYDSVATTEMNENYLTDSVAVSKITESVDSLCITDYNPKKPWMAVAEVVGSNLAILAVDRYILNEDFAKVTWHTIGRNLSPSKWYWDSDIFRTNLMLHPYHGSLYYNAARSNGMSFYESIPFAVGGSLMWEIAGESEQPSLNDFLATSTGGIAIGEVTHRISERIWKNGGKGAGRVFSELLGAVVNPMGAVDRLLTGKSFRMRNVSGSTLQGNGSSFEFSTLVSGRYYGTNQGKGNHKGGAVISLDIMYGSPVESGNRKPYDFFRAAVGFDSGAGQSLVSNLNIIGQIKHWMLKETENNALSLGIYQNFDYYSTDSINGKTPYKISEAGSAGVGLAWYHEKNKTRLFEELYVNGILFGGSLSDYRANRYAREYSVGSGYSAKSITGADCNGWLHFRLLADFKHLFSWKGYEDEDDAKEYVEYSVMGDRGNVINFILRPSLELSFNKHWSVEGAAMYVFRNFHYKYHPNVSSVAYDYRIGVRYRF